MSKCLKNMSELIFKNRTETKNWERLKNDRTRSGKNICSTKFMLFPSYVSIPNPIRIGNIFRPQAHENAILFIIVSLNKTFLI